MNLVEVLLGTGAAGDVACVGARGSTTYEALDALVVRIAGTLLARGITPGDRVALASSNSEEFVVAYLAILQAGGIAVPLNPGAPPNELERELASVSPRLALAAGPAQSLLRAVDHDVMAIDLDEPGDDVAPRAERDAEDPAVLLFTSGTAGAPKAAILTHGNLAANIRQVLDHPGLATRREDIVLGTLPFHHVFGLNVVVGVSLAAGAAVSLEDRFDAQASARHVHDRGVTIVAGVPTMYSQWLALDGEAIPPDTFRTVRLAVSGAAPLPPEVAQDFQARFGVVVHQGYGLTEAAPIVTSTAMDGAEPRPGSIGPPVPGIEVKLVDEDGADALAGDPGELWVRGPNVFPGYWHDDEATARVLTPDGWLRTGDIAVVEETGDLRLVDRAKDLIIVSGFNVFPVEVEEVLLGDPAVRDVAVIGELSPRSGEAVVAFVVAEPGTTPDPATLQERCARSLARYKCPSRIDVVAELPRSVAGKLLRRELRSPDASSGPGSSPG